MKTNKIKVGNYRNSLNCYIFITNEYGKPTDKTKELFINTFLGAIQNNNFNIYDYDENKLNNTWQEIKEDLKDRNKLEYAKYTGGYKFFKELSNEQYKINSREDLENFIENYKYLEVNPEKPEKAYEKQFYVNDIGKARNPITLILRDRENILLESIVLNTSTEEVFVKRSQLEDLEGTKHKDFDTYLQNWVITKYGYMQIDEYERIIEDIKQDTKWKAAIGIFRKPLKVIFDWA